MVFNNVHRMYRVLHTTQYMGCTVYLHSTACTLPDVPVSPHMEECVASLSDPPHVLHIYVLYIGMEIIWFHVGKDGPPTLTPSPYFLDPTPPPPPNPSFALQ